MTATIYSPAPPDRAAALARLDGIATFMDSAFTVPGTNTRIGADALLNVVPGVGSGLAKAVSAYLIYEAYRHGAPGAMLARMAGRVGIDLVLSVIPVVGWFGDAFYRANLKNIDDLKAHLNAPTDVMQPNRWSR